MNKTARVIVEQVESLLPRLRKLTEGHARPDHPAEFASEWISQEISGQYWAGLPDQSNRPALIFAIYAVRELNATGNQERAIGLLQEAIQLLGGNNHGPGSQKATRAKS